MLHVSAIQSNIKAGVNLAGLGTKVLIVGKNEEGKSAVTDSISLALQGFVPRVAGKDRARAADLMALVSHTPDGKPFTGTLFSTLTLTDNTVVSWRTSGSLASAKDPEWDKLPKRTKVFDLGALRTVLVESGDEPRRRFFLEEASFGVDLAEVDLFVRVPDPYKDLWQRFRGPQVPGTAPMSGAQTLSKVAQAIGPALRQMRDEIAAKQASLERIAAGMTQVPTQGALDEAHDAAERAKSALARHDVDVRTYSTEHARLTARIAKAQDALATIDREGMARAGRSREIRARLEELLAMRKGLGPEGNLPVPEPSLVRSLEALLEVTARQALMAEQGHLTHCTLCQHPIEGHEARRIAGEVEAAVRDVLVGSKWRAKLDEIEREVVALTTELDTNEQVLTKLRNDKATYGLGLAGDQTLLSELEAPSAMDVAGLTEKIERYAALQAALHNQTEIARLKADIATTEGEVTRLKGFEREIKEITHAILNERKAAVEKAVTAYLPEGEQFRLLLEYDGKNLCLPALERGGQVFVALSDSAWDRLVLAIGAALADSYDLAVLIGEDRAYHPDMLATTMRALSKAKAQIILTSPLPPSGRTPAGWQVIETKDVRSGAVVTPERKSRKGKSAGAGGSGSDSDSEGEAKAPETQASAGTSGSTTGDVDGDNDGDNEPAAETPPEPLHAIDPEPGLDAPFWARVRGAVKWTGAETGPGVGGITLDQMLADTDRDAAPKWIDPRASLEQVFFVTKEGGVARKLGKRWYIYGPLDSAWGEYLGMRPKDDFPFDRLNNPTILNQTPFAKGSVLLLSNLMRVYQVDVPGIGLHWTVFAGASKQKTLVPAAA